MSEHNEKDLMQLEEPVVDAQARELDDSEVEAEPEMNVKSTVEKKAPSAKQRKKEAKQQAKAEKAAKAAAPRYVGRITLGVAMIIMGLLITVGLFQPSLDLTKLARLAPLMLVVLGVEILVASFRRGDRQVKIGFGMTILCLFIIGGSVCFSIIPVAWEQMSGARVEYEEKVNAIEEQIYAQLDPTTIRHLAVYSYNGAYTDVPKWFHATVTLADTFQDKEAFSEKAAEVLQIMALTQELRHVELESGDESDMYSLSVDHVSAYKDVQAADLVKLVNHNVYYLDRHMEFNSMSEERYQQMKQDNLLADAEALKQAYEEGKHMGREEAYAEMDGEANESVAYEDGFRGYERGVQESATGDREPTTPMPEPSDVLNAAEG